MTSSTGPVPAQVARRIPEWTLADRLRKVRIDVARLTQVEMAQALGQKPSTYSAWESGRNVPANLLAFARRVELVSGVPATWLLGLDNGDGPNSPAPLGTDVLDECPQQDSNLRHTV